MRIHFIVRSLQQDGAGAHQNALSYVRYLKECGHTVTVHAITSFNNPPGDIALIAHKKESLGFVAGNTFLTESLHIYEKDADIFFLYGVDFIWGAGAYRKSGGAVPTVVYLDRLLPSVGTNRSFGIMYYLKRLAWEKIFGMRNVPWIDAFIAVSPFIQEAYLASGFPEDKFHIIPNFFEFKERRAMKKDGMTNTVLLLYVGRLTYDKGIDILINAVKDIPPDISWHLRIVGDGPMKEECENRVHKHALDTFVEITPWVDQAELQKIYESADIFIHASRYPESFGRTFVEAMSHRLPVVASNIGAASWTVGAAGMFFQSGNVQELRGIVVTLMRDISLRQRLGTAGIKRAHAFQKDSIGPHLEEVLETIKTTI